jgi:hypothetical protein
VNRREHDRLRFWLPLEVSGAESSFAISHDASDGGLLLVCDRALQVGAEVELRFRLPPAGPVEIQEQAEVIRVSRNEEDPDGLWPFKAAVRFKKPVPMLRAYLSKVDSPARRP